MLRRLLLVALLSVTATFTQAPTSTVIQPDCSMSFSFTATSRYPATGFSNSTGCTDWILQYSNTGFSAVSVEVDSAPDVSGVPGTWAAFTGKITDGNSSAASSGPGVNPNTATDWAYLRLEGSPAWVSVSLGSKTGTGRINGTLRGWKRTTSASSGGGGGGTPGGSNTQVQFNDSSSFGGNAGFTFGKATGAVVIGAMVPGGSGGFVASPNTIPAPSAATLSGAGAAGGSTTWSYKLVGGLVGAAPVALGTDPSAAATTAVGKAILDSTNKITITPPACVTPVVSYDVYRSSSPGRGLLGNVLCGATFDDTGLSPIQPYTFLPTDYSKGFGTNLPIVSTSNGSAFGCSAFADNDIFFPFFDLGTGLNVLTSDDCVNQNQGTSLYVHVNGIKTSPTGGNGIIMDIDNYVGGSVGWNGIELNMYAHANADSVILSNASNIADSGVTIGDFRSYFGADFGSGSSTVNNYSMFSAGRFHSVLGTMGAYFYGEDLSASTAGKAYYSWFDSQGVRATKEDGSFDSVGQAIQSLYNPQITKYVSGATDFERFVLGRWNANIAEIGAEKGGSGTLRPTRILGASVQVNAGGSANHAVCFKSDGKTLGFCSDVVSVTGTCTCN